MRILLMMDALAMLSDDDRAAIAAAGVEIEVCTDADIIAQRINKPMVDRHNGVGIPTIKSEPLPERDKTPRPDRQLQREANRRVARLVRR